MARVIYTGPLNPIIFARAKKEAEKAERIKGYTPRVIKTPSHTVVYSKNGAEVKAVVMDMLAPITFSIPGSAIPVAPNFLHLHPDLPEKVYGKESKVIASGYLDWEDASWLDLWWMPSGGWTSGGGQWLNMHKEIYSINSWYFVNSLSTNGNREIQTDALSRWDYSDGGFPGKMLKKDRNKIIAGYVSTGNGYASTYTTHTKLHQSAHHTFNGEFIVQSTVGTGENSTSFSYSNNTNASIAFFNEDIRGYTGGSPDVSYITRRTSDSSFSEYRFLNSTVMSFSLSMTVEMEDILDYGGAFTYSGAVAFPSVKINSSTTEDFSYTYEIKNSDVKLSFSVSCGTSINLSNDYSMKKDLILYKSGDYVYKHELSIAQVLSSCSEFDGLIIYCGIDSCDKNSQFVKSNLSQYFLFTNGEYNGNMNYSFHRPRPLITDGICLPHAWFFCRGNETRQTDFYPNNHNRLSIVIYPQGRHEFSVDEAEIVSVDLNHTPRFVARQGGGIAFVMQSVFGGNKLVPYVVNGLVEERDEYGDPTGFYLAQDGAISGEFKAPTNGGDPVVSFKLSPRQAFDGYRTVTVETTTEREYGVQTTFEVQGSGGVRVQQPPSITLERINESVLAGQSTVFYVTATQIAVGSNLRYEVKRAGAVVSAGYIELGNCAGWVEFTAPFQSVSVPGDPVRYVLGDESAPSTTPSTVEFEFSLVHEQAPPPVTFSVKFAHELYASSTDRPAALPMPPLFFLQPLVSENGEDDFIAANYQTTLINRIYYSLQSKRVYVLFWDGQSCDVSGILKQNHESGQYEYNQDWKETSFDYPPAADPYNIKGTLEPYVYAYMDYENNRNNGA